MAVMMFARKIHWAASAMPCHASAPEAADRLTNAVIDVLRVAIIVAPMLFSLPQLVR